MSQFCPLSTLPVFYQGQPVVGAKVYIYDALSTNPRTAYKTNFTGGDPAEPYAQPILTDANGCIPEIWIQGDTHYKVSVKTAIGVPIREVDELPGDTASVTPTPATVTGFATGDTVWRPDTAERSGFVKLNAKTLGSAASGADYSSDGNQALYILLYNGIASLTVSGGRGTSALADFQSDKVLTLPDMRFRTPFGLDTMGNTAAGRAAGVAFDGSGTAISLGSTGGEALHALATGELAAHSHTGATTGANGTADTGTTDNSGAHTHTGSTDNPGNHTHGYTKPASSPQTAAAGSGLFVAIDPTAVTDPSGAHTHVVTIPSSGAHSHAFSVSTVNHGHTLTTNNTGSGTGHNNMPPFILGTWFCKI